MAVIAEVLLHCLTGYLGGSISTSTLKSIVLLFLKEISRIVFISLFGVGQEIFQIKYRNKYHSCTLPRQAEKAHLLLCG